MLGPVTVVAGGVCLTGVLAAVAWKKFRNPHETGSTAENLADQTNLVQFPPKVSYGFSRGTTQPPKDMLIQVINDAQESLDIAIYTFTDLDIALEIIKAHRRGVAVRIITDSGQVNQNEYQQRIISALMSEGLAVKMNVQAEAFMHLKVLVADGRTTTAGSFNFTQAAGDKHEEVLVRIDDVAVARDWQRHFDYMWNDRRRYAFYRGQAEHQFAQPCQ